MYFSINEFQLIETLIIDYLKYFNRPSAFIYISFYHSSRLDCVRNHSILIQSISTLCPSALDIIIPAENLRFGTLRTISHTQRILCLIPEAVGKLSTHIRRRSRIHTYGIVLRIYTIKRLNAQPI